MEPTADIALIGLAVMGQNLILNMNDHGYTVVAFNRTISKVDEFLNDAAKGRKTIHRRALHRRDGRPAQAAAQGHADGQGRDRRWTTSSSMVAAPPGAGRHHHRRRQLALHRHHPPHQVSREQRAALHRHGRLRRRGRRAYRPFHDARRQPAAWPLVKDIFQAICAKTPDGEPCCDWVGENGAGHYVKMVHNGIEYGDMQLICEAYQLMKEGLGMSQRGDARRFTEWNKGELDSYLIEITRDILAYKDEEGRIRGRPDPRHRRPEGHRQVDRSAALDLGMPLTLIGEAVFARCLSAIKEERVAASKMLKGAEVQDSRATRTAFVEDIRQALLRLEDRLLRAGIHADARAAKEVPAGT